MTRTDWFISIVFGVGLAISLAFNLIQFSQRTEAEYAKRTLERCVNGATFIHVPAGGYARVVKCVPAK